MDKKKRFNELADQMMAASRLHDFDFRKTHKCKCNRRVEYDDGRWYCEAMQKSRNKDKEIQRIKEEVFELKVGLN